jgi:proteasome lid subunit RPN8/RPN11
MLTNATAWEAPGCPFQIEFAAEKLDQIRLAVIEGFYAVPHGGIEIGGVLFGSRDGQRIRIEDYRAIPCEHKTGPSFQLSQHDRAGLAALIASGPGEVLGWFHSHTRSEIFLSTADLEVYGTFFPQAWQVALVLRPANMQPTRAGYFFRDAGGNVAAEKSAREFVLEASLREETKKVRTPVNGTTAKTAAPPDNLIEGKAARVKPPETKPVAEAAQPVAAVIAEPAAEANYSDLEKEIATRRRGSWMWVAAAILALAVLAGSAYITRAAWMPQAPPPLKLQASDVDGKLFIRWNPVRHTDGKLTVADGGKETVIPLDAQQMSRGFYVYERQSEKTVLRMNAGAAEDLTTFAGPLQPKGPTPEEIQKATETEKVKADLKNQTLRNRQLQRKLKELSNRLQEAKP